MSKSWCQTAIVIGALWLNIQSHAQRVEFPSPATNFAAPAPPALPTFDPYAIPPNTPPLSAPALPPVGSPYPPPPVYGAPYSGQPAAIYPDGVPVYNGSPFAPVTDTWTKTMRFLQEVHLDETWLPRFEGDRGWASTRLTPGSRLPFRFITTPIHC